MLQRVFAILLLLPGLVFAETFVAGKDYEVITNANDVKNLKQITVTEYFSYGCPWCYRIESNLSRWVKQNEQTIKFQRIPVVFNKEWNYYAKAYYTAHLLGIESQLSPALFKAIQTDKQPLNSDQAMIDFFIAKGANKETVESAFTHSTTIDMKINHGNALMGRFHITGVPAVVVNNLYKTDLQMAQGEDRFFKILDYLVAKAKESA